MSSSSFSCPFNFNVFLMSFNVFLLGVQWPRAACCWALGRRPCCLLLLGALRPAAGLRLPWALRCASGRASNPVWWWSAPGSFCVVVVRAGQTFRGGLLRPAPKRRSCAPDARPSAAHVLSRALPGLVRQSLPRLGQIVVVFRPIFFLWGSAQFLVLPRRRSCFWGRR